ncbi:ROK family protein [Cohnella herbarum]|uniref:ROK family protein n=1 Tax=Cohnella herbarum TaxID=2728023 RepID=A0A7Z2VS64_9BACL|nr:ROK family protein [Cohnella herbarum]QJD88216.1 ROK family protein [Cohnella herbarum]
MLTAVDNRIDCIGAVHVLEAAVHGNEAALHIMDKPLEHMAMAIANIVSLLNPELVVTGGGWPFSSLLRSFQPAARRSEAPLFVRIGGALDG